MTAPEWIAVDWGTSHVRVWAMNGATILARRDSDQGMGRLHASEFEAALLTLLGDWLDTAPVPLPVVICGMAGARQGWHEAPYIPVPCEVPVHGVAVPTKDARLNVRILPGLSQAKPADVMRGEETQIGGFLASQADFDGVLCLPGTHTKWAHISAREVVSFRTFMTGEMFALLSQQSVLRFSTADGWDKAAFLDGVADGMGRPAGFAAELFSLRARDLLEDPPKGHARARLSGLLIGLELAGSRPYWLGQDVVVLSDDSLGQAYVAALDAQGAVVRSAATEGVTLAGLVTAFKAG
ncbi:2-dehydro-3-deoxygalactonokinase [Sagittula marina]|uniref:2-dehydro-3-deoxygalactonokinase n=1 Tax=Sagittula marina TaxID=943940 RepID=A0A7W6DIZ1_9RHOB|nr:2-dehydro-3-deoxygalactonokinase [Sagittula marina]MBB3983903.1 2-dehydro-3-deoxygalactonokinase [Sagittula marina]